MNLFSIITDLFKFSSWFNIIQRVNKRQIPEFDNEMSATLGSIIQYNVYIHESAFINTFVHLLTTVHQIIMLLLIRLLHMMKWDIYSYWCPNWLLFNTMINDKKFSHESRYLHFWMIPHQKTSSDTTGTDYYLVAENLFSLSLDIELDLRVNFTIIKIS